MMQYEIRDLVYHNLYAECWAPSWESALTFAIRFHEFSGKRKYFYVKPIERL